jgi:hypothetical protein
MLKNRQVQLHPIFCDLIFPVFLLRNATVAPATHRLVAASLRCSGVSIMYFDPYSLEIVLLPTP